MSEGCVVVWPFGIRCNYIFTPHTTNVIWVLSRGHMAIQPIVKINMNALHSRNIVVFSFNKNWRGNTYSIIGAGNTEVKKEQVLLLSCYYNIDIKFSEGSYGGNHHLIVPVESKKCLPLLRVFSVLISPTPLKSGFQGGVEISVRERDNILHIVSSWQPN